MLGMSKQIAALEISNREFRLIVGYVLDNKVDILYKTKRPLSVPFKDGDIFDIGSLSDDLAKINVVETESEHAKLTININEISLILPPYGLNVYKSCKTTNTVSPVSKIDKIDISNALALVKKERLPNPNDELVDIIPNKFIIDGNKVYVEPPLNLESTTISIDANVYTLPRKMVDDMKNSCEKAQIKVKKEIIAPLAVSYYASSLNFKYKTYILVDFSSSTTTLSFVGNNVLYASNYFSLGIDDLVDRIANEFQISREEAMNLKNVYGLDLRKNSYNPAIAKTKDILGNEKTFTKDDLNVIIQQFLKEWIEYFNGSLKNLVSTVDMREDSAQNANIILVGLGSSLNGLKDYLLRVRPTNVLEIVNLDVVGASEPEFINCLAAIYLSSRYRGALDDENKNRFPGVNREKDNKNKVVKNEYSELDDEL